VKAGRSSGGVSGLPRPPRRAGEGAREPASRRRSSGRRGLGHDRDEQGRLLVETGPTLLSESVRGALPAVIHRGRLSGPTTASAIFVLFAAASSAPGRLQISPPPPAPFSSRLLLAGKLRMALDLVLPRGVAATRASATSCGAGSAGGARADRPALVPASTRPTRP